MPSWRLAPEPENVAAARSFVRSALDGADPDLVETAALLAGELVTNVVLHARTEAEVWAWTVDGQTHVRVADQRPDRGLVPHDRHPYATTAGAWRWWRSWPPVTGCTAARSARRCGSSCGPARPCPRCPPGRR
ncbi:ATP-binding protein [Streptomyces longwoodensis]|uniref:ATP-binding protein n=1 Tax=Streptomyces longwoodensis TaxID=68231 RepID=UPI0038092159